MSSTPHPQIKDVTALAAATGGYWIDDRHLLHGPNVSVRLIPEASTQPEIHPRSAILHTNAGATSAKSLWAWITRAGNTGEPHFQVGYDIIEQYMPLNVRADCNYSANSFKIAGSALVHGAISFETQDNGSASINNTPWKPAQFTTLIGVLSCLAVVYGVHCTQPATWDGSGIGHHSLFPFQGVRFKSWTNVRGKTCPGRARIAQMDAIRNGVAHQLAEYGHATGWKCAGAK
jgi:hypothetical protein